MEPTNRLRPGSSIIIDIPVSDRHEATPNTQREESVRREVVCWTDKAVCVPGPWLTLWPIANFRLSGPNNNITRSERSATEPAFCQVTCSRTVFRFRSGPASARSSEAGTAVRRDPGPSPTGRIRSSRSSGTWWVPQIGAESYWKDPLFEEQWYLVSAPERSSVHSPTARTRSSRSCGTWWVALFNLIPCV